MADETDELDKTTITNNAENDQKEAHIANEGAIKANSEGEGNLECTKDKNKQNLDELKGDNTHNSASFKVPSSIQKASEPVAAVGKKEKAPELKYKEPWWSATPPADKDFSLEVLKNGCIISTLDLNDKAYHVFGRLPLCDVVLEHPSVSRYHALIQYRGETDGDQTLSGFYLYDLGSTHGTIVNKSQIRAKTYYRLKVGYVIKFGGSSRLFILQVCIHF